MNMNKIAYYMLSIHNTGWKPRTPAKTSEPRY